MPSLSDKLKSLGVQVGTEKVVTQPPPKPAHALEQAVSGQFVETPHGRIFTVEELFPTDHLLGQVPILGAASLQILGEWAKFPDAAQLPPEEFAFIDTEASGLSIGAGTFVTWITVGRFVGGMFQIRQFFLYDPVEEPAFLTAFEQHLAPCKAIVTYNGKSFDVPLLNSRFAMNRWPSPLNELGHIDLVHLARRLWRDRLPERRLATLETHILGLSREGVDVPGYLVPEIYNEYLHQGRFDRLAGVFYHNKYDVLSLAALMYHMAGMLADPLEAVAHDLDLLAVGKLYEDLGDTARAREIYTVCLGRPLETDAWLEAVKRLSLLFKKEENWEAARKLWKIAAEKGEVYACVELAKVCEHQDKDCTLALTWVERALDRINAPGFPLLERFQWKPELDKRRERLVKKVGAHK
ncbi:MAG TPA: ribonuclease H-like domain-containing protein [Anaerolineales bacterium]|nr:ribonuclease H-like domain-containing protein [Anaerolineales bacterium]